MDRVIVCVRLPRFTLAVASGAGLKPDEGPLALAPHPGSAAIGEISSAAEAFGIVAGMRLGEAMSRCPELRLLPPDPEGVAAAHERLLLRIESIGAAVESGPPGLAYFDASGLLRLHGGLEGVLKVTDAAVRGRGLDGGGSVYPGAVPRLGAAPSRFGALAASLRARPSRAKAFTGDARELARRLASEPVSLLALRDETAHLVEALEQFGIRSLGELAALPRSAMADRFGQAGLAAHDLAAGRDSTLAARSVVDSLEEHLTLPDAALGPQLEHALQLLIRRLLAHDGLGGRGLRAAVVSADLVEGGSWRSRTSFREPLSDPEAMLRVLAPKLADLPAPAAALRLRADGFGPAPSNQLSLIGDPVVDRRRRLREAARHSRSIIGSDAALRIFGMDPESRLPERRFALAPWDR